MAPQLILGPLLRYVSETEATVWVETSDPCLVTVLGHERRTFTVAGHHFALAVIDGLEPGSTQPYEVELDGERCWPPEDSQFPPSVIRTGGPERDHDMVFGSCRVAVPHYDPHIGSPKDAEGFGHDALRTMANEMRDRDPESWPEMILLLGDQIYVDEGAPQTRAVISTRRDTSTEPFDEVNEFREFCMLYKEAWSDAVIRWLFSTVSISMVWDDHDMSDDWNISESWCEEWEQKDYWQERLVSGFTSYWIYQHLGNLSPGELEENEVWRLVRDGGDQTDTLASHVGEVRSRAAGTRWSYYRDFGSARLIVLDSRAGRVLTKGKRLMVDDEEWDWVTEHCNGDFDHLILATTDPLLLGSALQNMEAWNERVCDGAWGGRFSKIGEKLRRGVDFDHWGSFGESFERMVKLIEEVGSGQRGAAPASIVVLSGDVHHAYLAEVATRRSANVQSRVYQGVCSPFRNPLSPRERRVIRLLMTRPAARLTRLIARAAGAPDPGVRWRITEGPYFDNQVATLTLDGREARMKLATTALADNDDGVRLERVFDVPLT